jgi:hypothetical protein
LVAEDIEMTQSNSILRHLGRKYDLMGSTEKDHCVVDMIIDGVESLRDKYTTFIYVDGPTAEGTLVSSCTFGTMLSSVCLPI